MRIPDNLILSADDIRYLRHIQLAHLTGIDSSNFVAWNHHRRISERTLERIALQLGMTKADLLTGLDLRRQDAAIARVARAKASQLIDYLNSTQELA